MIDPVEMIRFFMEVIPSAPSGQALSQNRDPSFHSACLREAASAEAGVTRRRVQNDNLSNSRITAHPLGEGETLAEESYEDYFS